jgi:hypothetical protein
MKSLLLGAMLALVALPAFAGDIDCGSASLVKSQKLKLEACVDSTVWEAGQGTGDQEFIYFTRDGKAGFAIVTEQAGGNDLKAYRDAILQVATRQSGAGAILASFDDASSTINGKLWGSMHYNVKVQDDSFEFLNYYYSEEGLGSTQFIFWSLPADAGMVQAELAGKVMPTVTVVP